MFQHVHRLCLDTSKSLKSNKISENVFKIYNKHVLGDIKKIPHIYQNLC